MLSGLFALLCACAAHSLLVHKYSTRVVRTKYGPLRGVILQHPPVEAFLGVPYATPPLGSLRYMPPVTPSMWTSTKLADSFSPVCPQRVPDIGNRTEALLQLPRGRLSYLEKLLPLLVNQSEDCLYLNLYVPRGGGSADHPSPYPAIVYVHGESYEWNSGNPYDGSVLAGYGHVIVVTVNYRLGVLGFLKTGSKGSAQGNYGLMDLVAGLHWLRENLPAFEGDPDRITLMGHGTGAALTNILAVSPVAQELLHRVVLLSGSALSPWAIQKEPFAVKRRVAEKTGCHGDMLEDDIAPCLRGKSLSDLLGVKIEPPRFLPGFAPFVDGTVLSTSKTQSDPALELSDFPDRDLMFGLTTTESYLDLSAQDLEFGFNESRRDRILRTYVRNAYYYHLNEIFSTLKNEYTDWERPVQNPLNVRDSTLEVLSDGHTAAPLIRVGYLHTLKGGKTYFLHFQHQSGERDYPQRVGSVRGEDVPYVLGLPLIGGQPYFPHNYTTQDTSVAKLLIHYLTNFARNGDPNSSHGFRRQPSPDSSEGSLPPFWDTYDSINQLYMELDVKSEMHSHYRGHKMSLWLNLIPQLHRPGEDELSMRHHHLEEGPQLYDGLVRPQTSLKPGATLPVLTTSTSTTYSSTSSTTTTTVSSKSEHEPVSTTTECPPNITAQNAVPSRSLNANNNLLKRLATSHYQSYTTALTVTIAVGCFLLLLNVLIFAGIYHQRDRGGRNRFEDKKKEELTEAGSCSSSSGETQNYEGKQPLVDHVSQLHPSTSGIIVELPLQEFKSSPQSSMKTRPNCTMIQPPCYMPNPAPDVTKQTVSECAVMTSPSIPEPPPPPKNQPPVQCNQSSGGILRQQGCPQTPGTMKKRVHIQEISV